MVVLSAAGLRKKYGSRSRQVVLDGLDLTLHAGDVYCLLGSNGSGKTTFLRLLLGILNPDQGRILYWGKPLSSAVKSRIGYLEESGPSFPFLRARDYLLLTLRLHGFPEKENGRRADEALREVGLEGAARKTLGTLSRGMEKRLGIAGILCRNPDLLLLDEPLEGLDLHGLVFFESYLKRCREQGKAVVFTTHLYAEVRHLATRVGFLNQGRLEERDIRDLDHLEHFADWLQPVRGAGR